MPQSQQPSAEPTPQPAGPFTGPMAGPPPGAPPGAPPIVFASTIAPSDTTTSIVVEPAGPQIQPGQGGVVTRSDIVYVRRETPGAQPLALKLDLLVPPGPGPKPLVVYVPGGGFIISPKDGALDLRTYVAEQGFAVASVEYRTVLNGATYVDSVSDVKSALRFLRAHAAEYGIDARSAAVWGESAGGYLAAMVGTTAGVAAFETPDNADRSSTVDAVVDKFGATHLARIADDFDDGIRAFHSAPGTPFAQYVFGPGTDKSVLDSPEEVAAADPVSYTGPENPPFLIMHGTDDGLISPSQTLLLHSALLSHGVDSTRSVLAGAKHGDMAFVGDLEAGLPWSTQETMGYIVEFLRKHLTG
ncbi:MAG: hypothetical protein QOF98_3673 [Streptomyces sp.]|nr:hypothetical protein [Streptomyces sp.]